MNSISNKLVLFFTAAAVTIFSITSWLLYQGMASSLQQRSSQYLQDEVRINRTLLGKPNGLTEIERVITLEAASLQQVQRFVRVQDANLTTLLESPGMGRLIPSGVFPAPWQEQSPAGEYAEWTSADGQLFILKAVTSTVGATGEPCVLQVALNSTRRRELLEGYRAKLVLVSLGGMVASLVAATLISRRGLRSLREITTYTQRVSASHLDERLQPQDWPRELQSLAGSFNLMLSRLQDSFDRLSQYASNMAHEFRTPLNNLMGEAEVALSRPRSPEEYRQQLESNLEEYRRLSQIVDSLLFLARAESGMQSLEMSRFELVAELRNLVDYYQPMIEEKGIELRADCKEGIYISADVNLVRRAFINLLSNALRFTQTGGTITVSCRRTETDDIAVTVADSGCGIAADEIPRLFDRFYRGKTTRGNHPQGHGLGLSIVKSIMDLHRGGIEVQSQLGVGSKVTLTFPGK